MSMMWSSAIFVLYFVGSALSLKTFPWKMLHSKEMQTNPCKWLQIIDYENSLKFYENIGAGDDW